MRTIGNIERFLVLGIVVVIGAILTVAITGARDLDRLDKERPNQVSAKTGLGSATGSPAGKSNVKKSVAPLKGDQFGAKPAPGAAGLQKDPPLDAPLDEGGATGTRRPVAIDPEMKKLLDAQQAALHGNPPPAPVTQSGDGLGKSAVADAPEVVDESRKTELLPLNKNDPVAPLSPEDRSVNRPLDPKPAAAKLYVYEVQKGDTLERIARALYGDGLLWKEILAANPDKGDGQTIRAGDHLKLPKAPTHASTAVVVQEPGAAPTPRDRTAPTNDGRVAPIGSTAIAPPATTGGFKRTTTRDQYQVQKGDTLMSIAAANYGTKAAWKLILDANSESIPDKDRIKTGIVLKLPPN